MPGVILHLALPFLAGTLLASCAWFGRDAASSRGEFRLRVDEECIARYVAAVPNQRYLELGTKAYAEGLRDTDRINDVVFAAVSAEAEEYCRSLVFDPA